MPARGHPRTIARRCAAWGPVSKTHGPRSRRRKPSGSNAKRATRSSCASASVIGRPKASCAVATTLHRGRHNGPHRLSATRTRPSARAMSPVRHRVNRPRETTRVRHRRSVIRAALASHATPATHATHLRGRRPPGSIRDRQCAVTFATNLEVHLITRLKTRLEVHPATRRATCRAPTHAPIAGHATTTMTTIISSTPRTRPAACGSPSA